MTEVDTERGRIALKLVSKHENGAEITRRGDRRALQGAVPERRPGRRRSARRATASARAAAAGGIAAAQRRSASPSSNEDVRAAGLATSPLRATSRPRRSCCCTASPSAGRSSTRLAAAARAAAAARRDRPSRASAPRRRSPGGGFDLGAVCERVEAAIARARARAAGAARATRSAAASRCATRPSGRERCARSSLIAPAGLIATGAVRPSWRRPRLHAAGRRADPRRDAADRRRSAGCASAPSRASSAIRATLDRALARELLMGAAQGRSTPAAGIEIVYAGLRDRLDALTLPDARRLGRARPRRLAALRRAAARRAARRAPALPARGRPRADVRGARRGRGGGPAPAPGCLRQTRLGWEHAFRVRSGCTGATRSPRSQRPHARRHLGARADGRLDRRLREPRRRDPPGAGRDRHAAQRAGHADLDRVQSRGIVTRRPRAEPRRAVQAAGRSRRGRRGARACRRTRRFDLRRARCAG